MSPNIVLIPFYNAAWQSFINFIIKSSHFLALLTPKIWDLLQNAGILRVLKNRELQSRKIQSRELQGIPLLDFLTQLVSFKVSASRVRKIKILLTQI